jgi:hypothetical protein
MTTLAACLRELGFRHTSCNLELTWSVARYNLAPVFEHTDQYESFEDCPDRSCTRSWISDTKMQSLS